MKKINIFKVILFVSIVSIASGCAIQKLNKEQLEQQRIELYIEVMKSVFQEENGGSDFIAIIEKAMNIIYVRSFLMFKSIFI